MTKILYFDCFAGISGDMTLGALIHLGVGIDVLRAELAKLPISGYAISPVRVIKGGIAGICANITVSGEYAERNFAEIKQMIEDSGLKASVKNLAVRIFTVIAEAEATVHETTIYDVTFHEAGAVDSIIDIVGAAICIDSLNIDSAYCSTLQDGKGFIQCRCGLIPVPVPAVVEMQKTSGIEIVTNDVEIEMVTPTGFGILKGLGVKCAPMPETEIIDEGFGFGERDTGRINSLRVVLGQIGGEKNA